jgi:hypothetical protein
MKKIIPIIFIILLVSGCIANNYKRTYAGQEFNFRADLREAEKIAVNPDEESLRKILLSPNINEIKLAYIPNDTENSFYLADIFEIAYKMSIIYRYKFGEQVPMNSFPINSTEDAKYLSNSASPVILFLGPSHANETSVTVDGNLIIIQGRSFDETNRKYTDLDLSTDKLILVLMGE